MRYVVLTAKHHEGFAMFRSDADAYNGGCDALSRDVARELQQAPNGGAAPCFYYSQAQDGITRTVRGKYRPQPWVQALPDRSAFPS